MTRYRLGQPPLLAACAAVPEGTMQQEQTFLALLTETAAYAIAGNQLTLFECGRQNISAVFCDHDVRGPLRDWLNRQRQRF
jgi:hypothetical protein